MKTLLIIAMTPMWLIGMLNFWHWIRPIKPKPEVLDTNFDRSNRINRIKLWWQNSREPWELAQYKEFKYLTMDIDEQAKIIEESEK